MNYGALLRYCLLLTLCIIPRLAEAQTTSSDQTSGLPISPAPVAQQTPTLSPGANEVAREIGVMKLIERLYQLPERDRGVGDGIMSLEALSLRQEISETVLSTSLDVDGVIAEIDNETAKLDSIRSELESKRDHAQKINNIASIVTGGALGVV